MRELSKSALADASLPLYPGIDLQQVHLIGPEHDAGKALKTLLACAVLGFDSESKPTFLKGEASQGPHLIQLATDREVFLFQVGSRGTAAGLKTILESASILKVGMGLGNDRSSLKTKLDITLNHVIDMGEVLRGPSHRGTVGAKAAVAYFFGQRLVKSKKTGTSNWSQPRLTEQQVRYAANDAYVALQIYRAWQAAKSSPARRPAAAGAQEAISSGDTCIN